MKRMQDLGIMPKVKNVEAGYNKFENHTIDESTRPISLMAGFVPVELVTEQKLKYDDVGGGGDEILTLKGFFANTEDDAYKKFLNGYIVFDTWGIFEILLDEAGGACHMVGVLTLEHEANTGKPKIRYCQLTGHESDSDSSGYFIIQNDTISRGNFPI